MQREKIVRWTPLENSQAQWVLDVIIEVEKFQVFQAFPPPLWPPSSKDEMYSPIEYDEISIDDEKLILIGGGRKI